MTEARDRGVKGLCGMKNEEVARRVPGHFSLYLHVFPVELSGAKITRDTIICAYSIIRISRVCDFSAIILSRVKSAF